MRQKTEICKKCGGKGAVLYRDEDGESKEDTCQRCGGTVRVYASDDDD